MGLPDNVFFRDRVAAYTVCEQISSILISKRFEEFSTVLLHLFEAGHHAGKLQLVSLVMIRIVHVCFKIRLDPVPIAMA